MADPSERLLALLSLLQRRHRWTGSELADQLGVTTRTVRRDVDRLRNLGYPVDAAPGLSGGYQLGVGGSLPPLLLDDDEATAVAVALGASTAAATLGIEDVALAALAKLHRLLPPRIRSRVQTLSTTTDLLMSPGEAVAPSLLVTLAAAIHGDERVNLTYADRDGRWSERRVEPYRLVATNRRWYLVAFDLDRGGWRTFRVDRVEHAEPTGHRFVAGERPDAARMVSEAISTAPYRYQATVSGSRYLPRSSASAFRRRWERSPTTARGPCSARAPTTSHPSQATSSHSIFPSRCSIRPCCARTSDAWAEPSLANIDEDAHRDDELGVHRTKRRTNMWPSVPSPGRQKGGSMAHPRTYSDADPYLDDLRRICLALPEAAEVEAWGRPTFRGGKKMFAMFVHQDGHGFAVAFKPDDEERPALVDDPRFYVPPYLGASGWLALDLTVAPVDWTEVAELLEASYRQVALKRMLEELEARTHAD